MKRILAILLVALLCISALAGCGNGGGGAEDEGPIKIGIFEPITGANAAGGALEVEGFLLAHELRPEVLGRPVELVTADNKSDKAEAALAASRLVEQEKVVAILGSWGSSLSIAAGDIVRNAQIPAIGASCTNPLVTAGNDYYFRVCFIDPYQGKVMANYAANVTGAKTAALMIEKSNDYSTGLGKFFEDAFKELTGNPDAIVARGEYVTGDTDFNAQLTNIAAAKPDVIFAPGNFTESALIVLQARQLGLDIPFLGGDTWETPEFINVGGAAVENVYFSTFFDPNAELTPKTKEFVEAYNNSKYSEGGTKEAAAVTALAFEAYNLLLDTIEKTGSTDGVTLRDALANTKDFEGVTGYVTFDENGDADKAAVIKTVKDGRFKYVSSVAAE